MHDLVTYAHKHNEANLEGNRDGTDDNRSSNYGIEAETADPFVNDVRARQVRNLMSTLLLSTGVPMLCAGDEFGRTQRGNNNAYCQDNEISWLDWDLDDRRRELLEFVRTLGRLRREHAAFRQRVYFDGRPMYEGGPKDLAWIGVDGHELSDSAWHQPDCRTVGMFVAGGVGPTGERQASFLLLLHAGSQEQTFVLPGPPYAAAYRPVIDTSQPNQASEPTRPAPTTLLAATPVLLAPLSLMVLQVLDPG
jgi:glycogen operon protein